MKLFVFACSLAIAATGGGGGAVVGVLAVAVVVAVAVAAAARCSSSIKSSSSSSGPYGGTARSGAGGQKHVRCLRKGRVPGPFSQYTLQQPTDGEHARQGTSVGQETLGL